MGCGASFLPPDVTIRSFLRSVIDRYPSVELADVAGVKPAVGVDHFRRRLGLLPVALHQVRPAREDFAVVRDAQLDAGQRDADGADADGVARIGA